MEEIWHRQALGAKGPSYLALASAPVLESRIFTLYRDYSFLYPTYLLVKPVFAS